MPRSQTPAPTTPDRFHWWATGANLWILAGLFLDGWSHINFPGEETFFTPWHGLLYSGVAAAVAVIGAEALRQRRRGLRLREAIPAGYGLSAVGGIVVLAGGAADGVWHELFGVEVGVEALLSPTHLTMAVAGALVAAGPLRAAWKDPRAAAPLRWAAVIASAFTVTLLAFFTQYVNPVSHHYATMDGTAAGGQVDLVHAAGIAGMVLWAAMLAGGILVVALRWRLPFGAVTTLIGIPSLFVATQRATYVVLPALIVVGLAIDGLVARWQGPAHATADGARPYAAGRLRALGAAVGGGVTAAVMLTAALTGDLAWSIHLVTGAVVVSAAAGLFAGLLAAPPAVPSVQSPEGPDPEAHTPERAREPAAAR
jgi:hypothetical protein